MPATRTYAAIHLQGSSAKLHAYENTPLWQLALAAALLATCLGAELYPAVWNTGFFNDPDDAMRMVQVRALIAGQSWYDMVTYRLDPGHGHFMHWSRIVDVFLVLLIKFFGLFLSPEFAERAARVAYPVIMLFALFLGLARAARSIAGSSAVLPSLFVCVLAGVGAAQFQPGRIDHHSMQIVLLVHMLAFSVEALEPGRASQATKASTAAAISLGISVENIPFIVAMTAVWPIAWCVAGERYRGQMFAYFSGLLVALPVVYLLTIGYWRWLVPGCDALTASYLFPAMVGAAACCALTYRAILPLPAVRFTAAGVAGGAALVTLWLHSPNCFGNPFSNVDPFLREVWLDNVHEARPLFWSYVNSRLYTVLVVGPAFLCGALALLAAFIDRRNPDRPWILAAVFIAAGIAATVWQIRAVSSLQPLAALGGAWLISNAHDALKRRGVETAQILALALALPLSTTGWEMASKLTRLAHSSPSQLAEERAQATQDHTSCLKSASYEFLGKQPPGLVLNPIDIGAHVLVYTHHTSLAAGYHRSNRGNRAAVDALISKEPEAEKIVRRDNVKYVALCPVHPELGYIRKYGPEGLGVALLGGHVPAWLERISPTADPIAVYRVRPTSAL